MAVETTQIIEMIGVSVVRSRLAILHDIQLTISEGESVALMGPNGAGKSTLLKCLAGTLRPTRGGIHHGGMARGSTDVRRQIGFAGHETGLYADLTALENLTFATRMHGLDHPADRARESLVAAGLAAWENRSVGQLSQGIKRRLAILRAVIHDPTLILLDEPFASLDSEGAQWLRRRFEMWRIAQRTVCFACHDLGQSCSLADRIVKLDDGRIAAIEQPIRSFMPGQKTA